MDEDMHINSVVDMNKVLSTSLAYFNKKRKFQAEQLGMPLPKHMCPYQSYTECSSSPTGTMARESLASMIKAERGQDNDSEPESERGSNSFTGDADSVTSGEAKIDPLCVKSCPSDQASTSSLNWGGNWSKDALYSLESRSVTKPIPDSPQQPHIGGEWDTLHHGSEWHPSQSYDEHLLEFGNNGDCTCPGCRTEGVEMSAEKELENWLYSNGVIPNNYVLSSGRWTVRQDSPPSPKKLTIDKEFEEYFSMLML